MHDLWLRLRAIFFKNRVEAELDDELEFHLEMETRKNIQAGMTEKEARRQARLEFGHASIVKEDCRDERRINPIETLRQDVRYALRGLRRTPTFALTVIATIGLGLGVNTALFTIFNTYVLKPLAVQDPNSLVQLSWLSRAGKQHQFTWPQYQQLEAGNPAFSELHAVRGMMVRVNGSRFLAELVTGNYFRMLGASAQLGRTLNPEDSAKPGGEPVVVLSANAWHKLFAADPNVVGKKIFLHGYPFEVVGVARDGFNGLGDPARDFWVPLTMYSQIAEGPDLFGPNSTEVHYVIARLKPGLDEQRAKALMSAWIARLTPDLPEADRAASIDLEPRGTRVQLNPEVLMAITPVFIAFGLILLIACANVANMMLARAMARQREIGIRLSLGAARSRLIRQLLTESVVLALPSAGVAFVVSQFIISGTLRLVVATLPEEFVDYFRVASIEPDYRVFAFMIAAAVLSGIVFGLAPALQATKASVVQAARGDFGHAFRPQRLRNSLVIVQVAVSVLLLICSGVLLKGANRLHDMDTGLQTRGVLWVELFEKSRRPILAELARQPLLNSIAASGTAPLTSGIPSALVTSNPKDPAVVSSYNYISPEYFELMGVPLTRGRNFTPDEAQTGAPVTIVSEALARRLWPDREPLGQTLQFTPDSRSHLAARIGLRFSTAQVIGIARNINTGFLENKDSLTLAYLPTSPQAANTVLLLKVNGDTEHARQQIDKALEQAAPGGIDIIHKLQEVLTLRVYPFRVMYWVSAMLGALAVLLTISGIYGVISYLVEQRQREMGIRKALGATQNAMIALVLRQSLRLAAIGVSIGVALALSASKLLASALAMIDMYDRAAYTWPILAVILACLAAAFIPSLRAARVDPSETLRHD